MSQTNTFANLSASGVVINGEGILSGMYVNSTTSGAIVLYSGVTATNTGKVIGGTITPAIGYHNLGNLHATAGVYVGIPTGAINVTFFVKSTD